MVQENAAPWLEGDEDLPAETVIDKVKKPDSAVAILETISGEVVTTEEDLPTSGRVYSETLDFDFSEIRIPKLRLASGLTKEVADQQARMGQWLLTGHEPENTVEVVIVGVSRFRIYALKDEGEVLCRSDDGFTGIGNPGGNCKTCPFAQWGEKNPKTNKSKAPLCNNGFSYQAFSLTHDQACIVDFKKTQLEAANNMNTSLYLRGARSCVFILRHEMRDSPVGNAKYPVPVVSQRPLRPDELERVNAAFPR